MRDKFAIDTNILVYAINKKSPKHNKAASFLDKARKKDAAIALRSLAELYNMVNQKDRANNKLVREFIEEIKHGGNFQILKTDEGALDQSIQKENNFWDNLIENTVIENGYSTIYTENTSDFKDINALNPFK